MYDNADKIQWKGLENIREIWNKDWNFFFKG